MAHFSATTYFHKFSMRWYERYGIFGNAMTRLNRSAWNFGRSLISTCSIHFWPSIKVSAIYNQFDNVTRFRHIRTIRYRDIQLMKMNLAESYTNSDARYIFPFPISFVAASFCWSGPTHTRTRNYLLLLFDVCVGSHSSQWVAKV